MKNDLRNKMSDVIHHYQTTQADGIKDIDKQIEIFAEDCIVVVFASSQLVKTSGIQVIKGTKALKELFQNYNDAMGSKENVHIEYFDKYIDTQNLICGFSMKIQVKTNPQQPVNFFNMLQFQLNPQLKIQKAFNWQGLAGDFPLDDIMNTASQF